MEHPSTLTLEDHSTVICIEVPAAHVVLLQAIIESYEGMGVVRTIDRETSLIGILTTPDFAPVVFEILNDISHTIPWKELDQVPQNVLDQYLSGINRPPLN